MNDPPFCLHSDSPWKPFSASFIQLTEVWGYQGVLAAIKAIPMGDNDEMILPETNSSPL